MTAKSYASATIAFGLVSIPVRLFTSEEKSDDISFNLLHAADNARLKQQLVCTACEAVVESDEQIKGYEHAPGQFVTFTAAELKALDAVATDAITIDTFVTPDLIDVVHIEKVIYLCPDKGSERAFALFVQALVDTKRIAVGTYAARGHEHVVAIAARGYGLDLIRLRRTHEVRSIAELPDYDAPNVKPAEREIARRLVRKMTNEVLDLDKYKDEVLARKRDLINRKVASGELVAAPAAAPSIANAVDLMQALQASLDVEDAKATDTAAPAAKLQPPTSRKRAPGRKSSARAAKKASTTTKGGRMHGATG